MLRHILLSEHAISCDLIRLECKCGSKLNKRERAAHKATDCAQAAVHKTYENIINFTAEANELLFRL
jgi:hypothetical protein